MSARNYPADRSALAVVGLRDDFFADEGKPNGLTSYVCAEGAGRSKPGATSHISPKP